MFVEPAFRGSLAFLSNMWEASITYDGVIYRSSENLYQAMKFPHRMRAQIGSLNPGASKRYARDWKQHRLNLSERDLLDNMQWALHLKFGQHPDLMRRLRAVDDTLLVEINGWHDNFWGDCRCGAPACIPPGLNWLGKMLIMVKEA